MINHRGRRGTKLARQRPENRQKPSSCAAHLLYTRLAPSSLGAALVAAPGSGPRLLAGQGPGRVEGIRDNMLVGYGLVVGLNGTGDSLQERAVHPAIASRPCWSGWASTPRGQTMQTKNVAAVMVTANLPAFAAPGHAYRRVGVSAMGDAKNLQGGTLAGHAAVRRRRPDLCAWRQGPVAIGGFSAQGEAASVTRGVPTAGRIANGAIVERETGFHLAEHEQAETVAAQSRSHHRHPHRQRGQRLSGQQRRDRHRSRQCRSCACPPIIPAA